MHDDEGKERRKKEKEFIAPSLSRIILVAWGKHGHDEPTPCGVGLISLIRSIVVLFDMIRIGGERKASKIKK